MKPAEPAGPNLGKQEAPREAEMGDPVARKRVSKAPRGLRGHVSQGRPTLVVPWLGLPLPAPPEPTLALACHLPHELPATALAARAGKERAPEQGEARRPQSGFDPLDFSPGGQGTGYPGFCQDGATKVTKQITAHTLSRAPPESAEKSKNPG